MLCSDASLAQPFLVFNIFLNLHYANVAPLQIESISSTKSKYLFKTAARKLFHTPTVPTTLSHLHFYLSQCHNQTADCTDIYQNTIVWTASFCVHRASHYSIFSSKSLDFCWGFLWSLFLITSRHSLTPLLKEKYHSVGNRNFISWKRMCITAPQSISQNIRKEIVRRKLKRWGKRTRVTTK